MVQKIYGVEIDNVTPKKVRDAIVTCFRDAHCVDAGLDTDEDTNRGYCLALVKKVFKEVGGNFDNPTKNSVSKVIDRLEEFALNFRDQEIVEKHYNEITKLIKKL